jgi:exopolyphosphatase/guanosine-5'-triphosphate,3'-diphosphate pyrophosphatase
MRVGAIDCGTNSLRLLIADVKDGKPQEIVRKTRINRLGYGVDRTHEFDKNALERTYQVLEEYAQDLEEYSVLPQQIRFVATSASRDANNRDDFFTNSHRIVSVTPEVISGDEEAKLSFSGVVSELNNNSTKLVVDLGGGSTELIVGKNELQGAYSMNIGSVRITERHFGDYRTLSDSQISAAADEVNQTISATFAILEQLGAPIESVDAVVGVAGTVTTLTAHALNLPEYSRSAISGSRISFEQMLNSADTILASSKEQLRSMPFMHPGRVDVIAAGSLIWKLLLLQVRQRLQIVAKNLDETITSEHDILDGIALSI